LAAQDHLGISHAAQGKWRLLLGGIAMSVALRRTVLVVLAAVIGLAAYLAASAASSGKPAHANRAGTVLIHVKQASLTDQGCGGQAISGGHFVINQITSPPASISVSLSDGTTVTAPLTHQTRKVGQYTISFTPGLSILDATAMVPSGWSGQFVLSNYLCGGSTPTPVPSSSMPAPPSGSMTS
jgi:hypothetical protein